MENQKEENSKIAAHVATEGKPKTEEELQGKDKEQEESGGDLKEGEENIWDGEWGRRSRRLLGTLRRKVSHYEQMGAVEIMEQQGWVRLERLNKLGAMANREICDGLCRIPKRE